MKKNRILINACSTISNDPWVTTEICLSFLIFLKLNKQTLKIRMLVVYLWISHCSLIMIGQIGQLFFNWQCRKNHRALIILWSFNNSSIILFNSRNIMLFIRRIIWWNGVIREVAMDIQTVDVHVRVYNFYDNIDVTVIHSLWVIQLRAILE